MDAQGHLGSASVYVTRNDCHGRGCGRNHSWDRDRYQRNPRADLNVGLHARMPPSWVAAMKPTVAVQMQILLEIRVGWRANSSTKK